MLTEELRTYQAGLRHSRRKLTRPRQAILDAIAQADGPLTPAQVYQRAQTGYPSLGLTTVYRTLDLLARLGYVQRVHAEGGCHSYAAVLRQHSHHLLCSGCGRTEDFACWSMDPLVEALQSRTGYRIRGHQLQLSGICPTCQAQGEL